VPLASINKTFDAQTKVSRAWKIFDEHGDFIRSVIRFNVKSEEEAEDLFQDLFLFLILKPIPEELQNVRGFLYRVICDNAKDSVRRITRYRARIQRYAVYRTYTTESNPESTVIAAEETEKMFELIQRRLSSKEALAITLRYRDNCDTKDVAVKMSVKPRTVSRYVSIGLKKVRKVFDKNEGDNYDRS
jgi:RNA polymerase sigma factor (sigma-70 family)